MRRAAPALLSVSLIATAGASPGVLTLNPTIDSGVRYAPLAIGATVGSSKVDNPIFVDYDTANQSSLVTDSGNSSATTIVSMAGGGGVNHAPYQVIAWPVQGLAGIDQYYAQLQGQVGAISLPHGFGSSTNHQLPAHAFFTSSPNSGDGNTGWGITFGLSSSYLGLNTASDSNDTGIMAGLVAALLYNHPSWNAFDAQAALRITGSKWPVYDHNNFGYGIVSWAAANSASTLYLQPPELVIVNNGYYVAVTINAYRQTRRAHEELRSCTPGYAWPAKNEYTLSDVTAGCGTLLYTSNGTDVAPTFNYAPAASGSVTLGAFTTDGSGNYSAMQEWGPISESLLVGSQCR